MSTPTLDELIDARISYAEMLTDGTLQVVHYCETEGTPPQVYGHSPNNRYYSVSNYDGKNTRITKKIFDEMYAQCQWRMENSGSNFIPINRGENVPAPFFYPCCRFCGQVLLPDREFETQDKADEWAAENCKCDGSAAYQREKKSERERDENIRKIKQSISDFDSYCASRGHELTDAIKSNLFNAATLVLDGVISSSSVSFGRLCAKVSVGKKSAVVLSFSYSDSAKKEAV